MTRILAAVDLGGVATSARLILSPAESVEARLVSPLDKSFDDALIGSVEDAQRYAADLMGWPETSSLQWASESIEIPLPVLWSGDSMFGPICVALMRELAALRVRRPEARESLAPLVRAVVPDKVAISAAYDRCCDRFKAVGQIERKLQALGRLQPDVFAVAIVSHDQEIDLPSHAPNDAGGQYELVTVRENHAIPVVKATDPIDAFKRLCALQVGYVLKGRLSLWIESLLYAFTADATRISMIAAATFASWFLLSDFFLADRFRWWSAGLEEFVFVGASALAALVVIQHYYWRIPRKISASASRIELVPNKTIFTAESMRVVLQGAADVATTDARARRFLTWKAARLERFDAEKPMTRPWWLSRKAALRWIAALWFPALLIALYFAPQTPWFEPVVSRLTGYPIRVFNITADGNGPQPPPRSRLPGQWVKESLVQGDTADVWRRSETAFVVDGWLTFSSTTFPHLSHRIAIVCPGDPPSCAIAADDGAAPVPDVSVGVRNGTARVRYLQMTDDLHLNMRVRLLRPDGTIAAETVIDPVDPQ